MWLSFCTDVAPCRCVSPGIPSLPAPSPVVCCGGEEGGEVSCSQHSPSLGVDVDLLERASSTNQQILGGFVLGFPLCSHLPHDTGKSFSIRT